MHHHHHHHHHRCILDAGWSYPLAQIVDSGSEFFSEGVLDRLILPECIKSVSKNSHTGCCYYFLWFQGFTTLTAKLFLLISSLDGSVASFSGFVVLNRK